MWLLSISLDHSGPRMPIFDNLGISLKIVITECWLRARWKRISLFNILKYKNNKNNRNFGGLGPKNLIWGFMSQKLQKQLEAY